MVQLCGRDALVEATMDDRTVIVPLALYRHQSTVDWWNGLIAQRNEWRFPVDVESN